MFWPLKNFKNFKTFKVNKCSHVRLKSDSSKGIVLVNRFIHHLQVVTTNNYNTIADFHTKSSVSLQ
jgi:hypothetical protein